MSKKLCIGPCGKKKERNAKNFRRRTDSLDGYFGTCLPCEALAAKRRRSGIKVDPLQIDPQIVKLVEFARTPISFSELCNKLDLSPKKTDLLVKRAIDRNAPIHVEHDQVSMLPPQSRAVPEVQEIRLPKVVGGLRKIGAISDTHLGSKYCLRGALRETIDWMYDDGIRDIVHGGDVLEGCYRHAQYELSHSGFDAQLRDARKLFPEKPGLRYHFISGNHDFTFEEKIGMRCGIAIQDGMRALGRDDWTCYGDRDAYVKLGGAVINLWHPRGGGAYAQSYNLQKRVEAYTAIKPQILLTGHYHQFCYIYTRGVHAIMMPTFQGSGSNFSKSLRGAPAIGGLILEWQMGDTGRIHNFQIRPRFFFEKEDIFDPRNPLDAIMVPEVGGDHRYRKDRIRL